MRWIKGQARHGLLALAILVLAGMSTTAALLASNVDSASVALSMSVVDVLRQQPAMPLQMPDGRRLTVDGQHAIVVDPSRPLDRQTFALPETRYGSASVVLPNGKVLIWGGVDSLGNLLPAGEWFDPSTGQFTPATPPGLVAGVAQGMTVLSDGRLLVADGWNVGRNSPQATTLWDPVTGLSEPVNATFSPRLFPATRLLQDGSVAVTGGVDTWGDAVSGAERFDAVTNQLSSASAIVGDHAAFKIDNFVPTVGAHDVPPHALVGLRFSQPVDPRSVSAATVSLIGPAGPVAMDVAAVQAGRLVFLTAKEDLLTGSKYSVVIAGIRSKSGQKLKFTSFGFTTAALAAGAAGPADKTSVPAATSAGLATAGSHGSNTVAASTASAITVYRRTGAGASGSASASASCGTAKQTAPHLCRTQSYLKDGAWYPGQDNAGVSASGHWRLNIPDSTPALVAQRALARHAKARSLLKGIKSATSAAAPGTLSGRVLLIGGKPIANVEVEIGSTSTVTDAAGHFTLGNIPAGHQSLFVDGTTANDATHEYGQFVVGVDVDAGGMTELPYRMYLPRILGRDKIELPSPTTHDMVITHPDIPGLEVHIPAGTVIRDHKGKVVTEFSIVPTPVDRAPYPAAANFPVYFSLEPGGATVQSIDSRKPQGLSIVYPNYGHAPAGSTADFFVYQPDDGWKVYGKGHVTADGKQIQPEAGVNLVWIMGGSFTLGNQHAGDAHPTKECGPCAGDPVDLWSGTLEETQTDIAIKDVLPINVSRIWHDSAYAANDTRMFGGWRSNFDMYLYSSNGDFTKPDIRLPDGNLLNFAQIPTRAGDVYTWRFTGSPSPWYGAILEAVSFNARCGAIIECYLLTTRDGMQFQFNNYAPDQLNFIRDRFGNQISLTWNAGLLQQVTSPSGRYISFTYDTGNHVKTATDNTGRTWTYTYHTASSTALGTEYFLDKVTYPDTTSTTYTYRDDLTQPDAGKLLTLKDRNGQVVMTNQYDPVTSRLTTQTLAGDATYHLAYALTGGVPTATEVTDPLGHVRRTEFDPVSGYPSTETDAYGTALAQTTTYARLANGLVSSRTDALGRQTAFTYDANGNVTKITALSGTAEATSTTLAWTSDYSQLASIKDPLGHTTRFTYTHGCLTSVSDPLGHRTAITCNGSGQPTKVTDALNHGTVLAYQGGDLRSVTDALGHKSTLSVDSLGRVTALADPQGHTLQRSYDSNDRLVASTDPRGQTTQRGYDHEGHLKTVTLPSTAVIRYDYNPRYELTERTDALNQSESWTYDALGGIATHTDRKGQTTAYAPRDALDRFTSLTYADGSTITADSYDQGNRLLHVTDSLTGAITRSYDDLDRLTGESTPQGALTYTYYANGLRKTMVAANQAVVNYAYDNANRLTGIEQGSENVAFAYDNANRRTGLTLPNGVSATYAYDNANELTGLSYVNASGAPIGALTYSYDAGGHRTAQTNTFATDQLPTATTVAASFDLNNRQTAFNGTALSYDANGNLTGDGTHTYTWNARNQLTQISQGSTVVASYSYDATGRRTDKTINGQTTSFLYDGMNAVQETQGSTVNPILTGLGVDERFARNEGSVRSYFLTDALGSTVALTNATASPIQQYQYDPYGNVSTTGSATNPYLYTGRENDGNGLYYYRARYYSPGMGRFISEDPLGFGGGQGNFYAYAHSNPLMYVDRTGQDPILAGIGVGIGYAWGVVNGYIAGDRGAELWLTDGASGAATGGLIGLTDGMSLLPGILARAGVTAEIELARQTINGAADGCIKINWADVGFAAAGSLVGDGVGNAAGPALSDFGQAGSRAATALGDLFGGAVSTTPASVDGAKKANP